MLRRLRREHNDRMTQAFYTAALPNQKKPTKLKDLLVNIVEASPRRRQTWQEQLSIARQWHAATTGRK